MHGKVKQSVAGSFLNITLYASDLLLPSLCRFCDGVLHICGRIIESSPMTLMTVYLLVYYNSTSTVHGEGGATEHGGSGRKKVMFVWKVDSRGKYSVEDVARDTAAKLVAGGCVPIDATGIATRLGGLEPRELNRLESCRQAESANTSGSCAQRCSTVTTLSGVRDC